MFTGIIEQTGRVVSLKPLGAVVRLTLSAPRIAGQLREGDSLAVSGVCLTALNVNPEFFYADLAAETLARSSLSRLAPGSLVNLELPTAAGAPLGGHIVQGHVDGTGTMLALEPIQPRETPNFDSAATDWWLTVRVPENVRHFMVEKGSVAIEGISLTIAASDIPAGGDTICIAILPLSYARTNLHALTPGAQVNVEADILLKSAAIERAERASSLTEAWLVANGY
uniref:Riboflavin synthase n=1 Tax=mine drainage metagenome TaxID=410659 RepID=E6QI40_9ZZZZ